MSLFVFLQDEWPALFDPAARAESLAEVVALFALLQQRAFREEL